MPDTTALARPNGAAQTLEAVLMMGDLKSLSSEQRLTHIARICDSLGLNPLTRPFEYLTLNGRLVLYAKKDCTDQLRSIHGVSIEEMTESVDTGVLTVTVKVRDKHGRTDMDMGSVTIDGLTKDALANARMKAATKAKRRATLSICGLGLLDETEIETIPGVSPAAGSAPSPAGASAAGEDHPPSPAAKVLNPETGHMVNPDSARQHKLNGSWERFTAKLAEFDEPQALLEWWESDETKANVLRLPVGWREHAQDAYEQRLDELDRQ